MSGLLWSSELILANSGKSYQIERQAESQFAN